MHQGVCEVSAEKVWVVFQDENTLWWLRFLHPGYRHCYVLVPFGNNSYLELNPFSNQLMVKFHQFGTGFDYISYLSEVKKRHLFQCDVQNTPLKSAPLGLFSCVEFTKRVLGIHSRFIMTPWQLYKKLKNCRKKVLTN